MSYCVKCKQKTGCNDLQYIKSNNRTMCKSVCKVCGTKKTQFVKSSDIQDGGNIITTPIKKVSTGTANLMRKRLIKNGGKERLLVEGEQHLTFPHYGSNWSGPGTRLDLFPDAPPTSALDAVSKIHDYDYNDAMKIKDKKKRKKAIRAADLKALKGYDRVKDDKSNHIGEYSLTRGGISSKIKAETAAKYIPFGTAMLEKTFGDYIGGSVQLNLNDKQRKQAQKIAKELTPQQIEQILDINHGQTGSGIGKSLKNLAKKYAKVELGVMGAAWLLGMAAAGKAGYDMYNNKMPSVPFLPSA
jgi:hypothetical protein